MKKVFSGKKVLVMGLGLLGGGVEVVKFFCRQGAKVIVTDLKTKKELKESVEKLKNLKVEFVLGRHRKKDFQQADLIVKNPAVKNDSPFLKIAKRNKIPVKTDIEIFFDFCPTSQIIGITGTKGKSTLSALVYKLLKEKQKSVFLGGNIGVSPLKFLPKIKKESKIVLELSSFALENLKKSPHIAIITCLFPDHLNRYKSFREYVKAKESIFKFQEKNDILILNKEDKETAKLASKARSKVYFFKGTFNVLEIIARIFKIPKRKVKEVIKEFRGIPGRQEIVAKIKGVLYVNDTTATTPQSTILAIKNFREKFPNAKIILIAGGEDKNLNYKNLAEFIEKEVSFLVLLPGSASKKIKKEIKEKKKLISVNTLYSAAKKAKNLAKAGDIVLFSPGATSFNLFKNEFDRGEQFVKLIKELSSKSKNAKKRVS